MAKLMLFCLLNKKANDLATVIRGHEVQKEGYYKHLFGYEEYGHTVVPVENILPVITVFSAPNYVSLSL